MGEENFLKEAFLPPYLYLSRTFKHWYSANRLRLVIERSNYAKKAHPFSNSLKGVREKPFF